MSQHSPKYDPIIRERLDASDWDATLPNVLKYAVFRAKKFRWLGDEVEPMALVQEAIARAYGIGTRGNYRNWNPETCPDLADFLIGIIKSMTSHKAEHEEGFPSESLFNDDGTLRDDKIKSSVDETAGVSQPKTPEEAIIENENLQVLKDELDHISAEDEDLGMVILCIIDGISKPRHIAEEIGFSISEVNNLLKRLRRRLRNHNPRLKG